MEEEEVFVAFQLPNFSATAAVAEVWSATRSWALLIAFLMTPAAVTFAVKSSPCLAMEQAAPLMAPWP